jgi:hypothetical protein
MVTATTCIRLALLLFGVRFNGISRSLIVQ